MIAIIVSASLTERGKYNFIFSDILPGILITAYSYFLALDNYRVAAIIPLKLKNIILNIYSVQFCTL